ncbi:trimeric intracellular cation channel family protein [Egicoccus sp. AB-alg2]|uniref:trimeric intracellular cation channel family protein n=1 Tax=Egicoccus sp. AB-alg2 TaxID=3242693 RepID=UPI00359D5765
MEQALVYVGTVTFAVTGALAAVRRDFDIVGVLVLAAVTAVGGGSIRDVVVGIVPPTALRDETLLWLVFATGVMVFALHRFVPTGRTLYAFDTVSLGLFAALGAERGLSAGFGFWGTVFAGAVSGVGGGVIRDLLTGAVPGVLYRSGDFYATAAAAGAGVCFLLQPIDTTLAVIAGAATAIAVRIGSRVVGLRLPTPRTEA